MKPISDEVALKYDDASYSILNTKGKSMSEDSKL